MSAATEAFLAMLAAERGAAANTLAAYRRDLEGAEEAIGDLVTADSRDLARLGKAWSALAPQDRSTTSSVPTATGRPPP